MVFLTVFTPWISLKSLDSYETLETIKHQYDAYSVCRGVATNSGLGRGGGGGTGSNQDLFCIVSANVV